MSSVQTIYRVGWCDILAQGMNDHQSPGPDPPPPTPTLGCDLDLAFPWSLTKPWVFWDTAGPSKVTVSIRLLVVQLVLARMPRIQHGEGVGRVLGRMPPLILLCSGMSPDASSKSHLKEESPPSPPAPPLPPDAMHIIILWNE